ncbi:MAG: glycosyltransferase [Gemmatimonadales bacterium]
MSALLLARDFPPEGGGIARLLGEVARHAPAGALTVCTGRFPESAAFDAGIATPVVRVGVACDRLRTLPGLARWAWRADRLARRADFLWAGNVKPAGHVARWVGQRRGLPYGLMVYGLDLQRLARQAAADPARRRRAAALLWDAAGTVAISRWTASRFTALAEELGVADAARHLRVVTPGVDTARFRPGATAAALRDRCGLDHRPWLLTVARLMPHKGVDTGLEVLQALRAAGHDVGYAVAGTGPDAGRLQRKAADLGVAAHVRWLGRVPDEDLPGLYGAAAVYLGLSRREGDEVEGFGLSLLEAQACGLPVVAGREGGTEDAVTHGVTGFLVEALTEVAAVRVVAELLADRSRRRVLGEAARARAEREFGWPRVVRDLAAAAEAFRAGRGARGGR